MADLCTECEALWRTYAEAFRAYLGLSDEGGIPCASRDCRRQACAEPIHRLRLGLTVCALKEKILDHESAAHCGGK